MRYRFDSCWRNLAKTRMNPRKSRIHAGFLLLSAFGMLPYAAL
nr:MAG TPA: hypothetical protein [Caudoviricetes sp.]